MSIDFSEARNLKRFPFLDAARGLACIGVVAVHADLGYLFRWYWGVMDFFFVMSGFLITRSLISNCNKGRGMFSFLLYRALRLLPAYVMVMLLYEAAVLLVLRDRASFETLPYLLFYQHTDLILGSVERFPRISEMLPFWSLVLEEQFYVLWGLFFCVIGYTKLKINLISLGIGFLLLGMAVLVRWLGVDWWTLPGRFDAFLMGSVASMIIFMPHKVSVPEKWVSRFLGFGWVLVALSIARLVWSALLSYRNVPLYEEGHWIDITCYGVISVVLVLGMVKIDIRKVHFGRFQNGLAFLGLISYEIYLVHFPVVMILKSTFGFGWKYGPVELFLIAMVVSAIIGFFMHKTMTGPALKRREQIHAFFVNQFGPKSKLVTNVPAMMTPNERDLVAVACESREDKLAERAGHVMHHSILSDSEFKR